MRKTYTVGGMTFEMRTFTGRDVVRVTGRLSLLPTELAKGSVQSAAKTAEVTDGLLALCSRVPKITLDEPNQIPEGTLPVSEIPDAIYQELVAKLCADSGYNAEAADEIRPSSGTVAVS
jgi:hypothetical protein